MTVVLDGKSLTLDDVMRVARHGERVELAPSALERMARARAVVEEALTRGDEVYGLTTGVGERKRIKVSADEVEDFQRLMILNHRVGQGPPAPRDVVRAMLLRLANGFAGGTAGVRPELAEGLVQALNEADEPTVRILGSVGEADLAPLADAAHGVFLERGVRLAPGEGLALINSNAFSTGFAALAIADAQRLLAALDVAGALDLEAFAANLSILHPAVADLRPFEGLRTTVLALRGLLAGSSLWDPGAARSLQDPLTFRCLPQLHGVARDALTYGQAQLAVELNAAQGNPLVLADEGLILSTGSFEILPLAAAVDFLRLALAPTLTAAAERAVKLLQAPLTGLPDGLAAVDGLPEDGLAIMGITAIALAAEARLLAQPVSFELSSSSYGEAIEDRMTMAPLAARRLVEMVGLGERIAAVELVVAAQAVDLREPRRLGEGTTRAHALVRERVPRTGRGEPAPQDLEPIVELVRSGALSPQPHGRG